MPSWYILSPEKSRAFGKIHKSATIVSALLHTYLINRALIFNFFSVIMYIETRAESLPHPYKFDTTFIFLPLFSFRKRPGADWSSAPGLFRFLCSAQKRAALSGRPQTVEKARHCEEGEARRTPGWPLLPLRGNSPSGNPVDFRTFSVDNPAFFALSTGSPHQSADWFAMTCFFLWFLDTLRAALSGRPVLMGNQG